MRSPVCLASGRSSTIPSRLPALSVAGVATIGVLAGPGVAAAAAARGASGWLLPSLVVSSILLILGLCVRRVAEPIAIPSLAVQSNASRGARPGA